MRVWALALVVGGCSFSATPGGGAGGQDAQVPPDAAIDGPGDGSSEPVCLGSYIRICVPAPSSTLMLMAGRLDTQQSLLCAPYTATPMVSACVVAAQSITIPPGNTVSVSGDRPLVLFSTGSITISGVLDGASRGSSPGPAADTGPCQTNFTDPTTGTQGGGSWGGSFGGPGHNGGNTPGGGIGGIAAPPGNVTTLTGGCPGGNGADNGIDTGGGSRGHGGGALLLIAKQTLTIAGTVDASGGGGGGGELGGGGGGGGSGGMIVLDATTVNTPGRCFANGGGGGEGGSFFSGRDGNESSSPGSAGSGGSGGAFGGGNGGNGGFGTTGSRPGSNGSDANQAQGGPGGGGAGGGGVGVIKVLSASQQNTDDLSKVSPPPS